MTAFVGSVLELCLCVFLARGITLPARRESSKEQFPQQRLSAVKWLSSCAWARRRGGLRGSNDLINWPGAPRCPDLLRHCPALTRLLPADRVVVVFILPTWHHQLELIDIDGGVLDPILQLRTCPSKHHQINSATANMKRETEIAEAINTNLLLTACVG